MRTAGNKPSSRYMFHDIPLLDRGFDGDLDTSHICEQYMPPKNIYKYA